MISVNNLYKSFNGKPVLKNINLKFDKGIIYTLMGPSGAGKTTLLKIINCLEIPSGGNVNTPPRRTMTFVSQKPYLFSTSVYNNIAYGLRVRGLSKGKIDRKVSQALKRVRLVDLRDQSARTLSGGETQRVSLARALVIEPDLLLLDEPTAHLDPHNTSIIEEIILRINEERSTTIIIATHNIFQAKRLADIAIFLLDGEVIEKGASEKIFDRPEDERTRFFLQGKMS